MPLTIMHRLVDKYVEIQATGKLTSADYARFVPAIDRLVQDHGTLRILFELHDFHGWSTVALWEDLKFDIRHFRNIERLAIVGETKWQRGMATFCLPFTTGEIRYFDRSQIDDARRWLSRQHNENDDLPVSSGEVFLKPHC